MVETKRVYNIYLFYLLTTLILFFIGPIEYSNSNKLLVLGFMLIFIIASSYAFWRGARKKIRVGQKIFCLGTKRIELKEIRFIKICIVYAFFLQWILILQNSMTYGISLSNFQLVRFFSQMAETYQDAEFVSTPALVLMSYTGLTKIVALVGGIFYFDKIEKKYKFMILGISVGLIVNVVLFIGSQKQLVDLFVYIITPIYLRGLVSGKKTKLNKKVFYIIAVACIVLVLGNDIAARFELVNSRYSTNTNISTGTINFNHPLFWLFPGEIGYILTQFISYISQGYRGLSLCLQLPFKWAYGVGSSFAMMNDISRWFNIPLSAIEVSYPVRMQGTFGVRAYAYWHTIFPWLASDFTWIGAIAIVSCFIYYWAKSLNELLKLQHLPALLVFVQLTILVVYIPCNNQLFQTRESIISTLAIGIIWYLFHGMTKEDRGGDVFE